MTEILGFIGDVLAVELATFGTTPITLGYMAAASVVIWLGTKFYRSVKGK